MGEIAGGMSMKQFTGGQIIAISKNHPTNKYQINFVM